MNQTFEWPLSLRFEEDAAGRRRGGRQVSSINRESQLITRQKAEMMKRRLLYSLAALFAVALAVGCTGATGMTGVQGSTGMTGAQGPAATAINWTAMKDIMFDYDRGEIRPSEMYKTSDIAAYVRQNPSVRLGIDGPTDLLRGTNQYNTALSQQRAGNVRDALVRAGVSADRMEMGGFDAQRVNCNDVTERCSQRDGRIEVLVRASN